MQVGMMGLGRMGGDMVTIAENGKTWVPLETAAGHADELATIVAALAA